MNISLEDVFLLLLYLVGFLGLALWGLVVVRVWVALARRRPLSPSPRFRK